MRRWLRSLGLVVAAALLAGAVFLVPTFWGKPWSIDHFFLRELAFFALEHPMGLSYLRLLEPYGLDFYSDDLEDFSLAQVERDQARAQRALDGLAAYDDDPLTPAQRVSRDSIRWMLAWQAEGERFKRHGYVVNQFSGSQGFLPDFLLNIHQVNDPDDAESYLARLGKFDVALDQMDARVRDAAAHGIVPPRFVLEAVAEQCRGFAEAVPLESPLYTHLAERLEDIGDDDAADRLERAVTLLRDVVAPAYARLAETAERLAADASDDAGVWKHPDGEAYYAWQLRFHTTTSLTPDEIHQIGRDEVARIHDAMREILRAEGLPSRDPVATLEGLGRDPRFRWSDAPEDLEQSRAEILETHRAIIAEVWDQLPKLFGRLPEAGVSVERVPEFREDGAAGAYYNPPPLDGSRPGVFYKNLANVAETSRFGMRTLTFHEAVPGHHLQVALALENPELPLYRRILPGTAFVEGWALYAERLAGEEGWLPTPYDELGQLQAELFRAVRLVVDTGLHAKRWSRDASIDYMVRNTGMVRSDVTREIERYAVLPGQACAYKVGQLMFLRLRERAQTALGERFDLRAFHDFVLGGGALPLEILEAEVEAWISRQ